MGESDIARGGDGGGYRGRTEHSLPPTAMAVVMNGGGAGRRRRRPRSPEEEAPPAAVQAVAAAAAGVEGAVRMAGYLEKRGRRRLVATWRRHWFVLQGRLLLRYRSRRDYLSLASCRGALNLGLASAVRPGPTAAGGAIEVVTRSQVVTLRARDKALRERWLAALLDAARGSTCTANTPPGASGPLGANGGPLGAGPHHFRYSLDHLPTALHRHDASPAAAAISGGGGGGGGGGPGGGGGMGAANARRSLSLEAVVPCAAARPKNVHPAYAHREPWAHAGGYGDSVLGVRARYDDEDAIFFYSSFERNLSRVDGGSTGAVSGGGGRGAKAAEDEELQPRSASASTAGSSTATASTAASGASSTTKPKRKGLKLRLRRRNTSEAESGCDGICSEPKRRPSFLERVLTSVRGGGGSSRSVSPLPPIRASTTPPPPPAHHSDPEYDSVPTTTLTGDDDDGEDGRGRTPTPQRDAMLAEDEDESSSCASSFEDEEEDTLEDSAPAPESEGGGCGGGSGGGVRVGAAGLVGSASLLPKPALVELRQRLRRRAESNRDSGDFPYDVTGFNGHAPALSSSQRTSATTAQDDDGAVFEGYEGFAELRRRWRERASDLAVANNSTPAAAAAQHTPQPEMPPPLPRKQRAAIAAALAAAQEEAALAAAAAMRASHGGKVREMATHFEAVASSGAARRRSDELGALLAQLAELTAAPLAPGPGAQRPPVPGAACVGGEQPLESVEYRMRSRKDSDPDYDIPRPHGAALGLASRAPAPATAIDASPFLGGGVHRAFAQLNVNVAATHGGDDSTDDGELSWTGLSMAPDSLEPLPVRLLDATG